MQNTVTDRVRDYLIKIGGGGDRVIEINDAQARRALTVTVPGIKYILQILENRLPERCRAGFALHPSMSVTDTLKQRTCKSTPAR